MIELSRNTVKVTRKICCAKGESAVDQITISRWLEKVHLGFKKLKDQERSGRPKTVESDAVFQAMEVNTVNGTRRVMRLFQQLKAQCGWSA